jgi:rubrerythrin
MAKTLNLKINNELLALLDKRRGDLPRVEFVEKILEEHLKNTRKNFSKLINKETNSASEQGENSGDMDLLIDNFQEFANDIYDRLDNLEDTIKTQMVNNESRLPSESEPDLEDVVFEIIEDSTDDDKSNEDPFLSTKKIDVDSSNSENSEKPDSDFEYGCPFCNATISENADQCPSCGNRFDDFTEVQPLSEGYSKSDSYDPRPEYLRRDPRNGVQPYGSPRATQNNPANRAVYQNTQYNDPRNSTKFKKPTPNCSICSGKLNYVSDYKRWYCHRCRKFSGGPPPEPRPDADTLRFSKTVPKQNPPVRVREMEPGFKVSARPVEPINDPKIIGIKLIKKI